MQHDIADADLLDRIRRDDPTAFPDFVDRFGGRIYAFGRRMCGDREDARDVLQDTLVQAYRALKDLEHPEALRTWIWRVAANACLMMRRKERHEPARDLSLEELMPSPDRAGAVEIPDPAALADEDLEREEMRRLVRGAIRDLPPESRIVLVMRDMEGLSTQEVAEALGLGESAVKMRLHRARLMVRARLAQVLEPR